MGTALLLGKCVTSCPKGYLLSQSATRGMICDDLYEGSPGIYCYIIWSLLALSLALLLLSFLARKSQFTFTSSLVSLFSVVEFLIRVGILVSVYRQSFLNVYIIGLNFVIIFTNCGIGLLFQVLYVSMYQENLKTFQTFKYSYSAFYSFANKGSVLFGIMFAEIFVSGLLKFPVANFFQIRPYRNSLFQMQLFAVLLSVVQFVVYIYIIVTNIYVQNGIWYLSITGVATNFLVILNW